MESDWTHLRDLFDRTVHLSADERARVLDEECATNPALRRRVEAMLAAHDEAGEFLAAPTEPRPDSLRSTLDAFGEVAGTSIGPYRLLQQIGEGGFGVVYMAEQQEPIVRKVALKIIKLGMDTKEVIARFEVERQALALMDHPNIAQIFDAGATGSGRPYFVMELVRGIPITEYCDRERLPPRQRLELFLPVCFAVAHAHQKGIIHRDLKPSNVLVTLHDGRPVPKVIDFGIARAIHRRLTERTLFTEYGQLIGTPEYMSPEQSEMSGIDIDTRTDIYSLGALLYELLTGEKLFDPRRLRSLALQEIQRVIREEEPARPSARVSSLGVTATEVAQRRGMQAPQLARMLRGDPDWIVLKAIAKDRTRRYDSAGALAEDIERSLRSEPVSAGPPGARYRVSLFVRRHRVGVTVWAVLMASLMLGAMLATLGFVQSRRSEKAARLEAKRSALDVEAMQALLTDDHVTYLARIQESIALRRSVAGMDTALYVAYLKNIIHLLERVHDPNLASFRARLDLEATDLMLATGSYDRSLLDMLRRQREPTARHQPDRLADVLRKIVTVGEQMGDPDSVIELDRRAAARLLRERGERVLAEGRPEAARPVLEDAIEYGEHAGSDGLQDLARAWGGLGECLLELGQFASAESLLIESYRVTGAREQLMRLVRLYERWGRPEAARSYAARTRVAKIRDLGSLSGPASTTGRGRAYSGRLGDRSIWVFGPAVWPVLQPLPQVRWNSWSWTLDRDARDGIALQHAVDDLGIPQALLTLSPVEEIHRRNADPGLHLDPAGVIEDPTRNRALILYSKVHSGPVYRSRWKGERAGSSLALWKLGAPAPLRVVVRPNSGDPTFLFQRDDPDFSAASLVVRDTLYLYGARNAAGSSFEMVLARSPLARALERSAWRFYAGHGRWSADVVDAVVVFHAARQFSVHWNGHLRALVALDVTGTDDRITMRTAERPEGPWSPSEVILTAMPLPPDAGQIARPAVHPELAREGGRVQYFTYERPLVWWSLDTEVRLVEVVFR